MIYRYCALMLMASLLAVGDVSAQTSGTCADGRAEAYLDVGNVRARIFNNGGLFWKGSPHVYEVPKGSGIHALFATSIWLGGRVRGELRMAASRYGRWPFWPGPLDAEGNPPADCTRYDHIFEITRDDLVQYARTGEPTPNLLDWPWHLGAPVLDGDGDAGNYNLAGGDRPALIGDQMLWWVMNDLGNRDSSRWSPNVPMGLEVRASTFAFRRPRSYIDNTTFYRYVLHYKGRDPLEKAYFGIYSDPDLGNFDDDHVGSDSVLHLAYVYNADDFDDGRDGYGEAPPAVGYTFLTTALAPDDGRDNDRDGTVDEPGEMRGMTTFVFNNGGGGRTGDPLTAQDYYGYMRGRWKDGKPLTVGGNGYDFSDTPTMFMYSGDPVTGGFWTEQNSDGQGTLIAPADRRFITASGPFRMEPGSTQEILFAIVWSRGTDHLDSITRLKSDVQKLRRVADAILLPDVRAQVPDPPPQPAFPLGFAQNYPNPFRAATTIRYSLPRPMHVRLAVYDLLGREVAVLVDAQQGEGAHAVAFDGRGLPPGLYVYRIAMDHLLFTRRMTLVR